MKINNLNHDKIEYKGNRFEEQVTMKEVISKFYQTVRQQMPNEGDFDDITTSLTKDDKGEYNLTVHTFLNNRTNKNTNCLNVSYTPDNKDFIMEMNLTKGSKREILDFLGNEKNLDKIKTYMADLRRKTDEK